MNEDHKKELREALRKMLPRERRLLSKPFKRKDIKKFPYRALQEYNGGSAAFIPSYRTYTREDIAILLLQARMNGGLLPVDLRMELLQPHMVQPNRKPASLMVLPDHSNGTRNRLRRLRKKFRR